MQIATFPVLRTLAFLLTWAVMLGSGHKARAGSYYDEVAYQEYRAAKRQQVAELCDIWFPTWRTQPVGRTYLRLAEKCAALDTANCGPELQRHLRQAERINTEIAELFAHGGMSDIKAVLLTARGAALLNKDSKITSDQGRRILELMRELAESETAVEQALQR